MSQGHRISATPRHRSVEARHPLRRERQGHPRRHPEPPLEPRNSCCSAAAVFGPTTSCGTESTTPLPEADDWFNLQVSGPNAIYVVEKACGQSLRDVKFMHSGKIKIAGDRDAGTAARHGGRDRFRIAGANQASARTSTAAVMDAGQGLRHPQTRRARSVHQSLEACFPTIITDYCPAIFDDDMEEYRAEFQAAMPGFATTFNIAGSFEAKRDQRLVPQPGRAWLGQERQVRSRLHRPQGA